MRTPILTWFGVATLSSTIMLCGTMLGSDKTDPHFKEISSLMRELSERVDIEGQHLLQRLSDEVVRLRAEVNRLGSNPEWRAEVNRQPASTTAADVPLEAKTAPPRNGFAPEFSSPEGAPGNAAVGTLIQQAFARNPLPESGAFAQFMSATPFSLTQESAADLLGKVTESAEKSTAAARAMLNGVQAARDNQFESRAKVENRQRAIQQLKQIDGELTAVELELNSEIKVLQHLSEQAARLKARQPAQGDEVAKREAARQLETTVIAIDLSNARLAGLKERLGRLMQTKEAYEKSLNSSFGELPDVIAADAAKKP